MKKHISMRMDEDVIYAAGEMARATHRSRTGYIEHAVIEQAKRDGRRDTETNEIKQED